MTLSRRYDRADTLRIRSDQDVDFDLSRIELEIAPVFVMAGGLRFPLNWLGLDRAIPLSDVKELRTILAGPADTTETPSNVGRPAGNRADWVKDMAEAMVSFADREQVPLTRVTWAAIAEELAVSDDTILYRRKRAKESVPEITREEVLDAAKNVQKLRVSSGDRDAHR